MTNQNEKPKRKLAKPRDTSKDHEMSAVEFEMVLKKVSRKVSKSNRDIQDREKPTANRKTQS